ncbi:hypothetical protein [Lentzea pudingi]
MRIWDPAVWSAEPSGKGAADAGAGVMPATIATMLIKVRME